METFSQSETFFSSHINPPLEDDSSFQILIDDDLLEFE